MSCIDNKFLYAIKLKIRYKNISEQKSEKKIKHGNYYLIKDFLVYKNISSNQLLNYNRTRDGFPASKICKKGPQKYLIGGPNPI